MIKYIQERKVTTLLFIQIMLLLVTIFFNILHIRNLLFLLETIVILSVCVQYIKQFHTYDKVDSELLNFLKKIIYIIVTVFLVEHLINFIVDLAGYKAISFENYTIFVIMFISISLYLYVILYQLKGDNKNIVEKIKNKYSMFLTITNEEKLDILFSLGYKQKLKEFYNNKKLINAVSTYKKANKLVDENKLLKDDYNHVYFTLKTIFNDEFDLLQDLLGINSKNDKDKVQFMNDWIDNI